MQRLVHRGFAFVALLCVGVSTATARDILNVTLDGDVLHIETSEGVAQIDGLTRNTVNVWYQPDGAKQLPSFAVDPNLDIELTAKLVVQEGGWQYQLPGIQVDIQASPMKLSFLKEGELLVSEEVGLFYQDTTRGFRFSLADDEKIMGAGQRVLGMDRRGHRLPLYNRAHYGYTTESSQMYYSLPAVMSSNNYSIVFDNSASGHLDIGHTEPSVLQFEAVAGRTAYLVTAGENLNEVVKHLVTATGKQPLPPRWALGNFASRFGYRNEQEVRDTIEAFEQQDIPVDAVVLDLYWFGPDIKGHMGNLNWDKEAWPNPEGMIADLRNKGVKTVVITEPFILTTSSQWQSAVDNQALAKNHAGDPRRFDFYFGNTGLVDVFNTKAQDWFWQYYKALADQGVEGWWGDLGEPEVHPGDSLHNLDGLIATGDEIHNTYGHQWAKMVYERQLALTPEKRPFVMMRAGFAGTQRYGMIPWTGDVSREWGGLKPQVELALQMGLFGLAYTHSDLGGFAGGESFDPELYTRWMQFGTFTPVYRPHAQEHIAPEPVFHQDPVKAIARHYIKLRYQLVPYIYSLAYQNSLTGMPLMRPLFMSFDDMPIEDTQSYMFGDAFWVSPVTDPGVTSISRTLPAGTWFNFWDNEKVAGGQEVVIDAPLEQLPVMVKAGSFVPMINSQQTLEGYSTEALTVHYYADRTVKNSRYTLFDDDGISADSLTLGQHERIHFTAEFKQELSLVMESQGDFEGRPQQRSISWEIHGLDSQPSRVLIDGNPYTLESEHVEWHNETQSLVVNTLAQRQLRLKLEW